MSVRRWGRVSRSLRPAKPEVVVAPAVAVEPHFSYQPYGGEAFDPLSAPAEDLGLPAMRAGAGGTASGRVAVGAGPGRARRAVTGTRFTCRPVLGVPRVLAGVREGGAAARGGDLTALTRAQGIRLAAAVVLAFIAVTVVLVPISD